ncbi:hypothetical protein [Streptomyces sp. CB01881]|nr:hypothetical protein [Streptomyces sp. CB01881]
MKDDISRTTDADDTTVVASAEVNEEISEGDLDAIGAGDGGQPTYPPYV